MLKYVLLLVMWVENVWKKSIDFETVYGKLPVTSHSHYELWYLNPHIVYWICIMSKCSPWAAGSLLRTTQKLICLHFCQVRQEVLKLYRTFFRTIRRLPDEQQKKEVAEWVRADFKSYKSIPVEEEIQVGLSITFSFYWKKIISKEPQYSSICYIYVWQIHFKSLMVSTHSLQIKSLIYNGEKMLRELKQSVDLSEA